MILEDLIKRLDEEFPGTNTYIGENEQGIVTPCFIVNLIDVSVKRELFNRFWLYSTLSVVFLPPSTDGRGAIGRADEIVKLAEYHSNLCFCLEEVGGLNATDLDVKRVDGALVATVSYQERVEKIVSKEEYMRILKTRFGGKYGKKTSR